MTAIKKYTILESKGFWIDAKGSPPKEVIVSFGKSSIIMSDNNEIPLNHWDLNSIVMIEKNEIEARFSPGTERQEELIIQDEAMIEALAIICGKGKSPSGKLLKFHHFIIITGSILIMLFFFFLPNILRTVTLDIIKPNHEYVFIQKLLENENLIRNTCPKQKETKAVENKLIKKHGVVTGIDISITKTSLSSPLILPGGIIIIPFDWFQHKGSYEKFELLLSIALKSYEKRRVFIEFLQRQKLRTLLGYALGMTVQFNLQLDNYLISLYDQSIFTKTNVRVSDEEWINIRNSCLN